MIKIQASIYGIVSVFSKQIDTAIKKECALMSRCNMKNCFKQIAIKKETSCDGSKITLVIALSFVYSCSKELTSIL